jgi:glycosyltransferase involved in cell wall biosynthesis
VLPTDISYEGKLSGLLNQLGIKNYAIRFGVLRRRYFHTLKFHQLVRNFHAGNLPLKQIIKKHNIKLIHSNTSAVLNGALAARIFHLPHIWHVHEILEQPAWLGSIVYRFIHSTSDYIVAVSHAVADHMRVHLPPSAIDKIQVIWNGVNCDRFHPAPVNNALREQWQVTSDEVLFGVVGRISKLKGQLLALSALAQAVELPYASKPKLLIVGSSVPGESFNRETLIDKAHQLQVQDKVIFVPFHDDVPSIMHALDVLLLPSLLPESLGLVILEAMASAKPVIASRQGGPMETVVDNKTGLHFTPNDVNALTNAMVRLANDAGLRTEMGDFGRQRALEFFSLEKFSQTFNTLYKKATLNSK